MNYKPRLEQLEDRFAPSVIGSIDYYQSHFHHNNDPVLTIKAPSIVKAGTTFQATAIVTVHHNPVTIDYSEYYFIWVSTNFGAIAPVGPDYKQTVTLSAAVPGTYQINVELSSLTSHTEYYASPYFTITII
jgi:hypothetical protein